MRANFGYTRYQYDGKKWNRLNRGTFYTRAHSLGGIAKAIKSINCPIAANKDLIVGYGYPEGVTEGKVVRIVWCPAIDCADAYECYKGTSTKEYDDILLYYKRLVEEKYVCE